MAVHYSEHSDLRGLKPDEVKRREVTLVDLNMFRIKFCFVEIKMYTVNKHFELIKS